MDGAPRRTRLWPPGGQTATHPDTLRHTRPRENVVFSARGVGSSPTSGISKPASDGGFRAHYSVGGQRGARISRATEGGPEPTGWLASKTIPRGRPSGMYFPSLALISRGRWLLPQRSRSPRPREIPRKARTGYARAGSRSRACHCPPRQTVTHRAQLGAMDLEPLRLLDTLLELAARADTLDPSERRAWIANTGALLKRLGSSQSTRFERLARVKPPATRAVPTYRPRRGGSRPPTSSSVPPDPLGQVWDEIQSVLAEAAAELSLSIGSPPQIRPDDILDRLELIIADAQDVAHCLRARLRFTDPVARRLLNGLCSELDTTYRANRSRLIANADTAVDAVRRELWSISTNYDTAAIPGMGAAAGQDLKDAHHRQEKLYNLQRTMVDEFRAMREADASLRAHPTTVNQTINAQTVGAVSGANITENRGASLGEVTALVAELRETLQEAPSDVRDEAAEILDALEAERGSGPGSAQRRRGWLKKLNELASKSDKATRFVARATEILDRLSDLLS